jgi:type II restriction enzyme
MKRLKVYDRLELATEKAVFNFLMDTLSDAIRTWDYFVNWDKVFQNSREVEVQLGIWDYLLGKGDFDKEFRYLLGKYPEIVMAIPSLIVRDGANSKRFQILISSEGKEDKIKPFDFSRPIENKEEIEQALEFVKESGLVKIFKRDGVKNLSDYLLGVEAGVDSNGRKNRSGTGMETLIEKQIAEIVSRNPGWEYLARPTLKKIEETWGVSVQLGNARRTFDFVIFAKGKLFVIEVNIYGGGGTKLKSVAGEFVTLHEQLKSTSATFVWITDGLGWKTTRRQLEDSFGSIDHIINLRLLSEGALEEIVKKNS